jgi:hypothetical protein
MRETRKKKKSVQPALKRINGRMHFLFSGTSQEPAPAPGKQNKDGAQRAAIVSQKQGQREIGGTSTNAAGVRVATANSSTKLFSCRFVQQQIATQLA